MTAVLRDSIETINLLIQNRANVNLQDGYGETALIMAASRGYTAIVKALLK